MQCELLVSQTNGIGRMAMSTFIEEEQSGILQRVDVGVKFERWSMFEVHGADQVVLSQKQQSLSVDLLRAEGLGHIFPSCKERRCSKTCPGVKGTGTLGHFIDAQLRIPVCP